MIDRFLGVVFAANFALGVALSFDLLRGVSSSLLDNETTLFVVVTGIGIIYLQAVVAPRDGLPADDEGVELWPLIGRLPFWAAALSVLLLGLGFVLAFIAFAPIGEAIRLPDGTFALREGETIIRTLQPLEYRILKNALHLGVLTSFASGDLILSAYCLVRGNAA